MKYNVHSKHGMYPMGKIIWATYTEKMRQTVACVIRERLNKFSRSSEEVQVLFSFKISGERGIFGIFSSEIWMKFYRKP